MSRARQVEKDARDESRAVQKKKIQAFPLSEFTLRTAGIFFFLSFFPHRAALSKWLKMLSECDEDQNSSAPEASGTSSESKWAKSDFPSPDAGARETGSRKLTPLLCANTAPKLVTGHVVTDCGRFQGGIAPFVVVRWP